MKATWTMAEQDALVEQLKEEGFPQNAVAARQFTEEMSQLIAGGYPFTIDTARMAMMHAGIEFQPPEPEFDEEVEDELASRRIQRGVDHFINEQAERMTDAQLQSELYHRGAFGKPVPPEERISDVDFGKLLRAQGML